MWTRRPGLPGGVQLCTSPLAGVRGYCGLTPGHVQIDHHGAEGFGVESGAHVGSVFHRRGRPRRRVRAAAGGAGPAGHDRAGPDPTDIRRVGGAVAYAAQLNAKSATARGSPCDESHVSRPRAVSEVRQPRRPSHRAIGVVPGALPAVRRLPAHVDRTGLTPAASRKCRAGNGRPGHPCFTTSSLTTRATPSVPPAITSARAFAAAVRTVPFSVTT